MNTVIKDEPTQEQLKRFWEWCGFWHKDSKIWVYPNGDVGITPETLFHPPDINFDNLIKYAITKLKHVTMHFEIEEDSLTSCVLTTPPKSKWALSPTYSSGIGKTPALALFWAIYQIIEKE